MNMYQQYKLRDFDFAQRLVTLRRRTGLTQEAVALRLGISEKAVRNWEGGSNYPTELNLRRLIETYLSHNELASEQEPEEFRQLWELLHKSIPHRIGPFDEQWFAALLTQRRGYHTDHAPSVSSGLFEQQATGSLPILETAQQETSFPRLSTRLLRGDWSEALDVSSWYGRTEELVELERWLLEDRCRLVSVLGMGGIGKTTLAVKLVQQVAPHFDCVMWRSLHNAPSLEDVLRDWLLIFSEQRSTFQPQGIEQSLALLVGFLQERRCLLVLDNLETLFPKGILEGSYREGYEAYAELIRHVAETGHRSCLLLASRELLPDLGVFAGLQGPVRVFRLGSLALAACQQLLQDKGLFGEQAAWSELVQRYAGNPLALKIMAETVRELFGGDIAAFLSKGPMTFNGIRHLLDQQFERLSVLEQGLLYWLAIERELIPLETFEEDLWPAIARGKVLEVLHSLRSRSLVERSEHGVAFTLQPVVLEYVTERLVAQMSEEISEGHAVLALTHSLVQAQAKDYVRSSQTQLLLQPVLDQLLAQFGSKAAVEALLERLLRQLRLLPRPAQGYGGGNIVNLLVRLNGHVRGKDCSQLTVWQASLQEAEAQDASFVGADLEGSVFLETIDGIVSVAVSPNGYYIAAGTNNGQIRLWRAQDGQPLVVLSGHQKKAWSLLFNAESSRLISGGYDGLIKVWEINSGECIRILRGHTRWVGLMAIHPAGWLLATGSDDRSIRLWDLRTGDCIKVWYEHHEVRSLAFSPDGSLLASCYGDGLIKLWEHESGRCLWSAMAHQGSAATSLAFSPDGAWLTSGGADATIMIWQVGTGKHLATLTGHTDMVLSVAFNAQGMLASGSFDSTVKVWQLSPTGQARVASQCLYTLSGHRGLVWSIAFGPDGMLASGSFDCTVKLWQISRGNEGCKCLRTLRGYSRLVNAVAFGFDGQILVSDESNGIVRVWGTESGRCLRVLHKPISDSSALAFHPDGLLLAQSFPDNTIKLWEVKGGQYVRTLQGHQGQVWSVAFSADGCFLLSGSLDRTARLWEIESGRCLATLQGHGCWVWSVACSPDGRLLASGDLDGGVRLWEKESGQCLHTLQGSSHAILALAFTSDSNRLLSSNAQDLVAVWDVQSGDCLRTIPGLGENYWLGSVAFSADGSLLATASTDQTVKLWDTSSGALLQSFSCGTGQPWPVIFSTDQRLLASGTDDGTILMWERQTGKRLLTLQSERPYERMNITGVTGITGAQKASLKALGAIDEEERWSLENTSRYVYPSAELMTPVQVYRMLGITRQSLYDRLQKGKLTPIYQHGRLRFLRSEIEVWKMQREQKGRVEKQKG